MRVNYFFLSFRFALFFMVVFGLKGCQGKAQNSEGYSRQGSEINCSDANCNDSYIRPEFIAGSDVAHQFSNEMCRRVGDHLKELYREGKYAK